jgi:hypothetical protein
VVDDKKPAALMVLDGNGKVIRKPSLSAVFSGNPDWEAMAKDAKGNYYLLGSRSALYTFRFESTETKINPTKKTVEGGFEIEGLAVREVGGLRELSFGIRERNSEKVRVYRSAVDNQHSLSLTPFFEFDAPGTQAVKWHLSSIEYVPELKGFLIITSTESPPDTNYFYGNRLWFVDEKYLPATPPKPTDKFTDVKPLRSCVFETEMKAEGLAVLSYDDKRKSVKLAIIYDNDFYNVNRLRPGRALPGKIQIIEVSVTPSP